MTQPATVRNPFMLMLNPEVVLAAVAKSERLSQLDRHLCRPLDRPVHNGSKAASDLDDEGDGIDQARE
jgi:hypothetical protein